MSNKYTDPAHELADFFETLRNSHNPTNKHTGEIVSKFFNVTSKDVRFHILIGAITSRCDRVIDMVKREQHLNRFEDRITNAILGMMSVFSYEGLRVDWSSTISHHINSENISKLEIASARLVDNHRLKILSPEERNEFLENIDQALEAADEEGLGGTILANSLRTLRLIMDRIDCFGYEALQSQLILTHAATRSTNAQDYKRTVYTALSIIVAIGSAIIWTNDLTEAVPALYDKAGSPLEWIVPEAEATLISLPSPQLLLPKPKDPATENLTNEEPADASATSNGP